MTMDSSSLDPQTSAEWDTFRAQAHLMLDDMLQYMQELRQRPVWQPIPDALRQQFREPLPHHPTELAALHQTFMQSILPYAAGNAHPGFMGWVHGGGTPIGMLAEMLAAGLNANLGGRDQVPIDVEKQVLQWLREIFGFPQTASGLFVSGTSLANFVGVLVARSKALGPAVRQQGLQGKPLVAYTSAAAHGSVVQALELAGLGVDALRVIPLNAEFRMDVAALESAIEQDINKGLSPFLIIASAGTVDTGSIDDLDRIGDIAAHQKLWLHVDGAFGALAMLSPELAPLLRGIQRADSIAFDFHKWGQVPYSAGFILVRDAQAHLDTFASTATYLKRENRGMSAGSPWPCDFGPDLSRGFMALKTWFTLKTYGTDKMGRMIRNTCELAQYLKQRIEALPELELLAPVALNIVCFRYRSSDESRADEINMQIVADLQESGVTAPSSTTIHGKFAIRAAIVNHRTEQQDIDALVESVIVLGKSAVNTVQSRGAKI
ncbi:MAG TPA: aspartate aminotransferase family protein [Methylophilaceae bacterium]